MPNKRFGADRPIPASLPWLLIGLWFLALALVHCLWIYENDRRMAVQDSYTYLRHLTSFDTALADGEPLPLQSLSAGGRPQLYQLMAWPFVRVFGHSEDSALLVNLPLMGVLIGFTYALGNRLGGRWAGLLSVVLVSTYPPAVHLSRSFTPYYAMLCWAPLSCWAMVKLREAPSIRRIWLTLGVMTAGTLLHPTYLAIFLLPGLVLFCWALWQDPRGGSRLRGIATSPLLWMGLLPGLLLFGLAVGSWAVTTAEPLLNLLAWLRSPGFASIAGSRVIRFGGEDVSPPWLWYVITAPRVLSTPFTVLGAFGIFYALRHRRAETSLLLGIMLLATPILGLASTLAWARGASILVVVGVLSALGVAALSNGKLRLAVGGLCIAVSLFNFGYITVRYRGGAEALAKMIGARDKTQESPARTLSFGPSPPRPRQLPIDAVIARIGQDMNNSGKRSASILLSLLWPRPFVEFYLETETGDLQLTSYQQSMLVPDYRVTYWLDSDYVLFSSRPPKADPTHRFARATAAFLNDPPTEFLSSHELLRVPGHPDLGLWSRRRPASASESREVHAFFSALLEETPGGPQLSQLVR